MEDRKRRAYSSWLLERIATGDVMRLCLGSSTIGRHPNCVIIVPDSSYVSRRHAEITVSADDAEVQIRDLNSINGIWVNAVCHHSVERIEQIKLNANDRIGVGVTDDSDVDPMYPVFLLKYAPLRRALPRPVIKPKQEVESKDDGSSKPNAVEAATASVSSTSRTLPGTKNQPALLAGTFIEISDDECHDEGGASGSKSKTAALPVAISTTSNTVLTTSCTSTTADDAPVTSSFINSSATPRITTTAIVASNSGCSTTKPTPNSSPLDLSVHMPKISIVKQEYVRSMSADIQKIFGETDDVILEKVKDINPYLYNDLNGKPIQLVSTGQKPLVHGDLINLTSDDEEDRPHKLAASSSPSVNGAKTNAIQSPNIFEGSLNSSKELENIDEQPTTAISANEKERDRKGSVESVGSATAIGSDVEDENYERMFSQVLVNDIKAEMAGNEERTAATNASDYHTHLSDEMDIPALPVHIKSEPTDEVISKPIAPNKEMDSSCWIISDEEDYDEELEHKVSGWTNKLFSQNLSQLNMSQVFEDSGNDDDFNDMGHVEVDDDYFDDNDFYNRQLDDAARIVDEVVASLASCGAQPKSEEEEEFGSIEQPAELISKSSIYEESHVKDKVPPEKQNEEMLSTANGVAACNKPTSKDSRSKSDFKKSKSKKHRKSLLPEQNAVSAAPSNQTETDGRSKDTVGTLEHTKIKYHLPPVIDAPQLPKHKGKLRGVSAMPETSTSSTSRKVASLRAEMRAENYSKDLKRKWYEKPKDAKRREKEYKRFIKESRKERLKELAEKSTSGSIKKPLKRTLSHGSDCDAKKAKIKITTVNRGALLAEDVSKDRIAYKIPKRKPNDATSGDKSSTEVTHASTAASTSTVLIDAFAQEISKPDELITKRKLAGNAAHTKSLDSQTNATATAELPSVTTEPQNEALKVRAQRPKNKITFASMQKNFIESRKNQKKLQQIFSGKRSCLADVAFRNANTQRTKKQVRFNDEPVVYYIERVNGANKKVDKKDLLPRPTFTDRRHNVRSTYTIVDCTNKIITQILNWSNEWLVKRNARVDAAINLLLPMPNQFTSINYYKSIIFPLMKLEFVSMLEREYGRCQTKTFTVSLENVTENKDRLLLVTKTKSRSTSESRCELAVVDWGSKRVFAYISGKYTRPGGICSTIVFEIIASSQSLIEELRSVKELSVRPVVDNVRVEFGAFNAVYQLESTPLFSKILNPLELCKSKPPSKRKISYKGFDKDLNERQQQVLLSIYAKAIEPIPNITLLQGPPGTGKSCVITNLVLQMLYGDEVRCLDQKVLICAQSNAAVDVLAEKLFYISQKMRPDIMFRLIRFGVLERINPKVQPASLQKIVERNQIRKLKAAFKNFKLGSNGNIKDYLKDEMKQLEACIEAMKLRNVKDTVEEEELREKQRQLELMRNITNGCLRPEDERSIYSWYLSTANIVCATLSSCVKLSQYVNYFDVCIIDEATQCTEPWTLLPLKFGINSLILVGDTQQLPATVLSKKAYDFGLGTSLFTRIQRNIESVSKSDGDGTVSSGILFNLQTQYRMHPEICKWPNSYFYKNELINAPITLEYKTPIMAFSVLNLQFTQNDNCVNGQIINEQEVKFVEKLVRALDAFIPINYNTYGVITPYAQQRNALESALRVAGLHNVMVNTIDSYQGIERDVIIISNARTTGIGFLAHHQRLNVALTRPKKCLLLCGNFKNLESAPTWRSLLKSARERNLFHEISVDCFDDMLRNVIDKIKIAAIKEA